MAPVVLEEPGPGRRELALARCSSGAPRFEAWACLRATTQLAALAQRY